MDHLSLFSALISLRNGVAELPPFEDEEMRIILAQARPAAPADPSLRADLAIGLAAMLEGLALRLRSFVGGLGATHV